MILGGAAATGSFAIQLAKNVFKAGRVVTTASQNMMADGKTTKLEFCKGLGADEVIDYKEKAQHWSDILKGQEFDLIFDCIGLAEDWTDYAQKVLSSNSKFVSIANFGGQSIENGPTFKVFLIEPNYKEMDEVLQYVADGRLKVQIDREVTFEDLKEGLGRSIKVESAGKIVVKVCGEVGQ